MSESFRLFNSSKQVKMRVIFLLNSQ